MKLSIISLLTILSAGAGGANAECDFCLDGIAIAADTVVLNAGGETCGTLSASAPTLDANEWFCTGVYKVAESICCPDSVQEGDVATDGSFTPPAADADDTNAEPTPCSVCSNGGLTVAPQTIIPYPDAAGASCQQMLGFSSNFDEDSDQCSEMKEAEAICCPPDGESPVVTTTVAPGEETAAGDPCSVCSDGLTVEVGTDAGEGRTCGDLVEDALTVEEDSDICDAMKGATTVCCPAPVDDPCSVCADGLTVEEGTEIGGAGGPGEKFTCGRLMLDKLNVEESNAVCDQMKGAESTCCPAEVEVAEPCSVCSGGITVDESTEIGRGGEFTCGSLIVDALTVEESSETCDQMKGAKPTCCPATTEADEPCSVCSGGLTVEESTAIDADGEFTCGGLITDALATEEDSDVCAQMKVAEEICCPTAEVEVEDPCLVCSEGITVDEATVFGEEGKTCGGLVVDALTVEESTETCDEMKGAESTCCPTAEVEVVDSPVPTTSAPQAADVSSPVPTTAPQTTDANSPQPTPAPQTTDAATYTTPSPIAPGVVTTDKPALDFDWTTAAPTPAPMGTTTTTTPVPTPYPMVETNETPFPITPSPANSTSSTTASPVVTVAEDLPVSNPAPADPVFQEPQPSGSSCLVASSGVVMLTSIISTVMYAMTLM